VCSKDSARPPFGRLKNEKRENNERERENLFLFAISGPAAKEGSLVEARGSDGALPPSQWPNLQAKKM